ncbi:MAG: putative metalloprotease CJM1_0395 family protein [Candidatus Sumerlaeia bacterium]
MFNAEAITFRPSLSKNASAVFRYQDSSASSSSRSLSEKHPANYGLPPNLAEPVINNPLRHGDQVSISSNGREAFAEFMERTPPFFSDLAAFSSAVAEEANPASGPEASRETGKAEGTKASQAPGDEGLTEEEQREVDRLEKRDREVRAHEQAHKAAGGMYAGAPSYTYESGPDNKRYAVGGEVPIDMSPIPNDPQATVQKMQVVQRAALAPANPSAQDRSVAAQASKIEQQARSELRSEQMEKMHRDMAEQGEHISPDQAVSAYSETSRAGQTQQASATFDFAGALA